MTKLAEGHICKNCQQEYIASFCNHCGQRTAHRITLAHVSHDVMHLFLHADKGIFHFMKRIITSPGYMAREYINGKRKIFNPYQYLLLSIGVIIFLMVQSGFYEQMEHMNDGNLKGASQAMKTTMAEFNYMMKKHTNVITYVSLPLFAFFSWMLFRKRGNNFAEHLTLLVFIMSQINTLNAVFMLGGMVAKVSAIQTAAITLVLSIVCSTITYSQFYKLSVFNAAWKGILVYLLFYSAQMLIMLTGFIIYVILSKGH